MRGCRTGWKNTRSHFLHTSEASHGPFSIHVLPIYICQLWYILTNHDKDSLWTNQNIMACHVTVEPLPVLTSIGLVGLPFPTNRQAEVGVDLRKLLVLLPMWISFVLGSTLGANFSGTRELRRVCRFSTPNLNRTEFGTQPSLPLKWSETIQIHHFFWFWENYTRLGGEEIFSNIKRTKKKPNWNWSSLFQRIPLRTPKYLQLLNTHPLFTTRNVLSLTAKTERCLLWTWAGTICTADSSQLHFNPWPCLYSAEVGWGTVKPGWFTQVGVDETWNL